MGYLKDLDANQIAKVLKIEPAASGKYDYPNLIRHEGGRHNSGLSISEDGSFSCLCGIKLKGWSDLVSKINKVPRWRSEKWLQRQLERASDG